jgi:hypothetical protein
MPHLKKRADRVFVMDAAEGLYEFLFFSSDCRNLLRGKKGLSFLVSRRPVRLSGESV